jgi:hypothetical protein
MNPQKASIAILATLSASLALADDFKTLNGKEYKDGTVTRVEPDGIFVKTRSAISKLYFVELPTEVQQRFNYDPQSAAAFSAAEAANFAAAQNRQQNQVAGAQREQAAPAQNLAKVGEIQATVNAIHALEGRYAQIQSEEAIVQQKIHEMESWHLTKLERADLQALREQLSAQARRKRGQEPTESITKNAAVG